MTLSARDGCPPGSMSLNATALAYLGAGRSVLPVAPRSKTPGYVDAVGTSITLKWQRYQKAPVDADTLTFFLAYGTPGLSIVTGVVSGVEYDGVRYGLEVLDIDNPDTFEALGEAANWLGLGELLRRMVCERTPRRGGHFGYLCAAIAGNQVLARRPPEGDEKGPVTLVETRGEGGQCVVAPTPPGVHPDVPERGYELVRGSWEDVPIITPAERASLLDLARSLNTYVERKQVHKPPSVPHSANGTRPGDALNASADTSWWSDLLARHGWTLLYTRGDVQYWQRPGKEETGCSATLGACGPYFYCFSSNALPFEQNRGYTPFSAFALLEHDGDFSAAAHALTPSLRVTSRAANDPEHDIHADVITELASLSPMAYDQRRAESAKILGVRVGTLDAEVAARRAKADAEAGDKNAPVAAAPAPWGTVVDGAQLLDDVAAWYRRYLVLPDGAADTLALWTLHTYAVDAAQISPRLAIVSPQKRCGKTTLLTLISMLTPRVLAAANITAAALFRAIEAWRPTMLIDEADTFLKDNEELRGVLNAGHYRPNAYVVRAVPVGDSWLPQRFWVWGPVAIALIGRLPSTLADRSITVRLRRKTPAERVERFRLDRPGNAEELRRRCLRWVNDHLQQLTACDPAMPETLNDRAADNWRVLCAIAEIAGGEWPVHAKHAMTALATTEIDDDAAGVMLLEDIKQIFKTENKEELASKAIVTALHQLAERPWSEWGKLLKPLTQRQLAGILRPFEIKSRSIRDGNDVARGYTRGDFDDAWLRYLPDISPPSQDGNQSATALQPSHRADVSLFLSATPLNTTSATVLQTSNDAGMCSQHPLQASNGTVVADENASISALNLACSTVADRAEIPVADTTALTSALNLARSTVADKFPESMAGSMAETSHPPCAVCGGSERWDDAGNWRCVRCWPQEAL